ncbi:MAG: hypothetical protein PHY44_00710 [Lachnospiraceae bacterium]|nr:hypothetical protein [Lachnospiraceae bacterium]
MRFKKFCCVYITLMLLCETVSAFGAATLNIETAKKLAVETSSDLQDVKIDRIKKQIELQQAKDGIRDTRKKDSTIRFSLLLNIEFPTGHGMPKEIELIMKVPQIQNEITVLNKQEPYETLKAQTKAEQAYYDVLQEQHNLRDIEDRLAETKRILSSIETKYKLGKGKKADVEYVKNQQKDLETSQQKSAANLDVKLKKLGGLVGKEVRYGYQFPEYFPEVSLQRNQLTAITEYAKANDFELFKTIQERKLAERDTEEILQIYKSKYGSYINDIEAYIRYNEGKTMDYDKFIQMYNHTLTQIDSPWVGSYVIKILFFKIYIPKEWFKGEYSGTRYMEDQKYALFVSLTERDKARKAEKDAIAELEDTVYNAYSNLKQMESAYSTATESLDTAKKDYEEQEKQNKLGLVSFADLESTRQGVYTKQNGLYEMKMEYAKALSNFNLTTSGYITHLLSGGDFSSDTLKAGDTFLEAPTWYINNSLTQYNFEFGVNVPQDYGVDEYQLFYEGMPVGDKLSIGNTLMHLPLTYGESTLMEVRFYQNGELKYKATFDGGQYDGELIMVQVSGSEPEVNTNVNKKEIKSKDNIGSWNISQADTLRSKFSVNTDERVDYTEYEVFLGENSLGKTLKNSSITTLGLYFSDKEKLLIRFYKDGKEVQSATVQKGNDSGEINAS